MNNISLKTKFNFIYLLVYGALACYYPFLAIYFKERGLTYTEIGIAFALNSIISVVLQPIWGYITDRYLNKKKTLVITMILSSIFIYGFVFAKGFYFVALMIILYMTFLSPICSVLDAYCYEIIDKNKNMDYGRIRLMGSIGYAVIALTLGEVIKRSSINSAFYGYFFIIIIPVILIKNIDFKGKSVSAKLNLSDIIEILKDSRFIIFITSVTIISIALGANGSYIAMLIQKTGGDVSKLGILWFIVAISELPSFFFGNKLLKRYGELNLFIISLVLYALRFFLDSIFEGYSAVIIVQLMQGITFPFYLMAALAYLNKIIPGKMRASGMTLFSAIGGGVGGFIGNIGGGIILETMSIFSLYRILSIVSIIAVLVAILLKRKVEFK